MLEKKKAAHDNQFKVKLTYLSMFTALKNAGWLKFIIKAG